MNKTQRALKMHTKIQDLNHSFSVAGPQKKTRVLNFENLNDFIDLKNKQIKISKANTSLESLDWHSVILIVDDFLLKKSTQNHYRKKNTDGLDLLDRLPFVIKVKSGEGLKSLQEYERVLSQIQKWQAQGLLKSRPRIVAFGGGSVGDFAGFVASTYQRGCELTLIPTTWLSAIDSAHGGKNGLNLNGAKNQIGTFYLPAQVVLIKSILYLQNSIRLIEAFGELTKIGMINSPSLIKNLKLTPDYVWSNLATAIKGKMRVVLEDPYESSGHRQILNLGHTMGHVYESAFGWSHGLSVLVGLVFALRWSFKKGYLTQKECQKKLEILFLIPGVFDRYLESFELNPKKIKSLLLQDKKRVKNKSQALNYIFITNQGIKKESVTVVEILNEFYRQKGDSE